jgi:hypothetical protein
MVDDEAINGNVTSELAIQRSSDRVIVGTNHNHL